MARLPVTLAGFCAAGLAMLASPAGAATITVKTTADQFGGGSACALREAVQAANVDAAFGGCTAGSAADRIKLPGGTYRLTIPPAGGDFNESGDLDNNGPLTIDRRGRRRGGPSTQAASTGRSSRMGPASSSGT